jgi:hypothetical protein
VNDAVGTLPTADEAQAFLGATDPDRRSRLIDVGAGQFEVQFGSQFSQPSVHLPADTAAGPGQQFHPSTRHAISR